MRELMLYPESDGEMSFVLKVQFEGGSKVYEYSWRGGAQLPSPATGDMFAVVDARGEPEVVQVTGIVPYHEKWFEGDLKEAICIFSGSIWWKRPKKWRRESSPSRATNDLKDDDIPF